MTTTAHDLFTALASAAEVQLSPPPRAAATAATLRQLAMLPSVRDLPLDALTLRDALRLLSEPTPITRGEESTATHARRDTCREISTVAPRDFPTVGAPDLPAAIMVWRAVAGAFTDLATSNDDPRQRAIAATWDREAHELVYWLGARRREYNATELTAMGVPADILEASQSTSALLQRSHCALSGEERVVWDRLTSVYALGGRRAEDRKRYPGDKVVRADLADLVCALRGIV